MIEQNLLPHDQEAKGRRIDSTIPFKGMPLNDLMTSPKNQPLKSSTTSLYYVNLWRHSTFKL
jgi:hypothetical protein